MLAVCLLLGKWSAHVELIRMVYEKNPPQLLSFPLYLDLMVIIILIISPVFILAMYNDYRKSEGVWKDVS